MKWRNHALMAASIGVIMDLNPWEVGYCVLGANLPDQLEKIGRFRIIGHRTWTHELLLWLLPLLALLIYPPMDLSLSGFLSTHGHPVSAHVFTIRCWVLLLPGVIHLAGDLFTPRGVQVAGRKMSMRLFETGHPLEYLVAALFVALAILHKAGTFTSLSAGR